MQNHASRGAPTFKRARCKWKQAMTPTAGALMKPRDQSEPGSSCALSNTLPAGYPSGYTTEFQASDGTEFTVRPIRPDDEPRMVDFHRHLSEETVYRRYFVPLRLEVRTAHERLLKRCLIDYQKEMALVATYSDQDRQLRLAAVARLVKAADAKRAEVAFVVADQHQHHGLGKYLLDRIID